MTLKLNLRQKCDYEMIVNGGFYPLKGFLKEKDYLSVCSNMRLDNGKLWTIPITLAISEHQANEFKSLDFINLIDETGLPLAKLKLSSGSIFKYDWKKEAKLVFGSEDDTHPYTKILKDQYENGLIYYLGGELIDAVLPKHYDFKDFRFTTEEIQEKIKLLNKNNTLSIVGFQTRNPMHRSHLELAKYAMNQAGDDSILFLNPVVGATQLCDVDYHTRVRCYLEILKYFPKDRVIFSLLPLSMRMAGPREAVWHALIRKNFGCTHFAVGRDHAGPSYKKKDGTNFYGAYEAQELLEKYQDEIGIKMIKSKWIVYTINNETKQCSYKTIDQVNKDIEEVKMISGTDLRKKLENNDEIPSWFSYPEVVNILQKDYLPINKRGLCIYLIGLSGSGKTTLARAIMERFKEIKPNKKITYLDGDIVRNNLSKGLGFSREDRSTNVRRIGYVASEVVKHNGITICANIAPYQNDRDFNREQVSANGNYFQIWVDTKLEICEQRDVKGLYKLAREGVIKNFTGISDPFEDGKNSDLIVDGNEDINLLVENVFEKLKEKLFI